MTSRPGERGWSKIARHLLATGLTLSMGYAFGLFTLGGCGSSRAGFAPPTDGQLPERVVEKLTECTRRGPVPLQPVKHTVAFDVFMNSDGQVEQVALRDSTFHLDEVEACMEGALNALSEGTIDASLRRRAPASPAPLPPETRALLGNPIVIATGVAEVALVVGLIAVTVVVYYQVVRNTQTHRPPPPIPLVQDPPNPSEDPKPEPKGTTDPPPPPAPPPPPRRYPNQTCDDDELDRLESEKDKICKSRYAADCRPNRSKKMRGRVPCSAILITIQQRLSCLAKRRLIQERCFGGIPDAGHKQAIDQEQDGINNCEALKLINCAKGHPMAGL